jgi:hypothetical protein
MSDMEPQSDGLGNSGTNLWGEVEETSLEMWAEAMAC